MMHLEELTAERIKEAAAVEAACLQTAWSEKQLAALPPEAFYLIALLDGVVCGIGCLYCVAGEAELQNLAVLSSYRRRGVAQALLDALFAEANRRQCEAVFLEVAVGNTGARALYERNGFLPVGMRPCFYRGEDALLMKRALESK